MFRKIIYIAFFLTSICYAQYDTVITSKRDTINNVYVYDTLIYPQSTPLSASYLQFLYSRRDTNTSFNQTLWYDIGRGALWFKKNATKKYNLLIYDSLYNYLNNKSAYGYLGEGTDNYVAKFTTTQQTATIPVMTSNHLPTGQSSDSHGGNAYYGFNENILNYTSVTVASNYTDYAEWNSDNADSSTAWIIYKFPSQKSISKYIMGCGYWYGDYEKPKQGGGTVTVDKLYGYPTAWKLYGSADSLTWVKLDSCTGQNFGGAVDTTGTFVNGHVNSYTLTPVTRATFTDKNNIGSYLYYKILITAFHSGEGKDLNKDGYYKIMIGSIQMYEGATVNFADSKIHQSVGNDTVTVDAITKTTGRAEIGGALQANGQITGLKDGIKFYDTNTPYKYNLFETYGQTTNNQYRMPQSLPSANQYLKALTISGSDPYIISLGWGTDALGGGGTGGGNVYNNSDSTAGRLTKWVGGNRYITSSSFYDGSFPMWWNGSSYDTLATRAWHRANDLLGTPGSGEANTYSTVGGALEWTKTKTGVNLPFKGVTAGSGISIIDNTNYLTISATSVGGYVGNKVSTAVLPLYKTNDTTITLKGLTGFGLAGQVPKVNSTATGLEWGDDNLTSGGSSGGNVWKTADTTAGYLTKWYDGHTIKGSLFSETSSGGFWNGDTLVRVSHWRLHDKQHPLTSSYDHTFTDWGGFPGDTMILKTNGNTLFWGPDKYGTGSGGTGDLTGTGYTTAYVKYYPIWTGTKTLGYIGTGLGLRDSSTSGGARFSLIPSLIAQGSYPKYYGDSIVTNKYYRLHNRVHGMTNLSDHNVGDWFSINGVRQVLKSDGINIFWDKDSVVIADSSNKPGYASKWYVDSCVNARIALFTETHIYGTVEICGVTWQATNLNTAYYRNGDPIPRVTDPTAWENLTTGAYCDYNNDVSNSGTYGRLYNWYAVNDPRGLAPTGWHVATDAEWTTLSTCVGGLAIAGGKLKEIGTIHWSSPNSCASNEFNFTALPSGYRKEPGAPFGGLLDICSFWSSTEQNTTAAYAYELGYINCSLYRYPAFDKWFGLSVRCVKD